MSALAANSKETVAVQVRGRSKRDFDLASLARSHKEEAIKLMVDTMTDENLPRAVRLKAARSLRALGFVDQMAIAEDFEAFIREMTDTR